MSFRAAIASLGPRSWTRRSVPWIGGLFIGVIAGLAGYEIVQSYRATISNTGRELDTQARTIAEQTARSLQAVDVVLRHLAEQFRVGTFPTLSGEDLHLYLKEQAVGLVQAEGLVILHATGVVRATSGLFPLPDPALDASDRALFQVHRGARNVGLYIGEALQRPLDGRWGFPMTRRLESSSGEFAGVVGAGGRIDYFQQFYRDVRLDQGTKITLMHQNGTLLARHPTVESALGKRFSLFDEMLASHTAGRPAPTRTVSPVDGVERFGALRLVPDYPLAVIVTRDTNVALAPWREQSIGTAVRTLALGALAALLLAILMRQLSRLYEARASLEVSQERYALAVAGSDDGIWDWDYRSGQAFASARAREILGLPPGPQTQSIDEWFAGLERQLHPEDAPRRI